MGSSGAGTSGKTTAVAQMTSHEKRSAKPIPQAASPALPRTFNIQSFLEKSLASKKMVNFQKNAIIFSAGEPAGNVLFIEKGIVRLSVTSSKGKAAVVAILDAGNFCGIWCLAGQPRRTATATAMAPTTARVISKDEMLRLLRTNPAFSEYFISFLLKRNIQIGQQVIDLLFDPSERRLIRALLFLTQFGERSGDDATLSRIPQELLAEMIGSTRTHVNAFMTKLKRLGFIEYNRGLLRIHRTPLTSLL